MQMLGLLLCNKRIKKYNKPMESQQPHEQEPQESGREMVQRVLGEILQTLDFEETELMEELRAVAAQAIADEDPFTALTAYDRYQEIGGEVVAQAADRHKAQLALNIACARLLAVRGEQDRCIDAIGDCVRHAKILGQTGIADELGYFLT
jgi:hypothetical protein